MFRKSIIPLICIALFLGGCASTKPNPEALKSINKVALVTLNLDRVGKGPNNDPVLKSSAGFAATVYRQELGRVPGWTAVEPPAIEELESQFSDLTSSVIARQTLQEMADQDRLDVNINNAKIAKLTMAALTGNTGAMEQMKAEIVEDTLVELQNDLNYKRDQLVWPNGKAGIPVWLVNGAQSKGKTAALREITGRILDDYCQRNGLDGVILVHQASAVGKPGDIRVIVQEDRVLSSIKVNPFLILRSAGGEIALSAGSNRLDDLAPMKLAMPIYAGYKKRMESKYLKVNLSDPKGTAQEGYYSLISSTAKDLFDDVLEVLQKQ